MAMAMKPANSNNNNNKFAHWARQINSFIHSFIRSFIRSFIHSFIHSFVRSFIHSFIHSFITHWMRKNYSPLSFSVNWFFSLITQRILVYCSKTYKQTIQQQQQHYDFFFIFFFFSFFCINALVFHHFGIKFLFCFILLPKKS